MDETALMELSIVIPVFEERAKVSGDVRAAGRFLAEASLTGEIIVVDDGSADDTAAVAQAAATNVEKDVQVLRYEPNRGKGHAVRTGMLATKGDYVMFADSGSCVPYESALAGLKMLRRGDCDLAHGSRRLPASVIVKGQDWDRRFYSRLFHWGLRWGMQLPRRLTDTQCGFKMYRGQIARELYQACGTQGFMFDVEVILRALRAGLRIEEFPVEWTCDRDSRVSLRRSGPSVLRELRAIKRALASDKPSR